MELLFYLLFFVFWFVSVFVAFRWSRIRDESYMSQLTDGEIKFMIDNLQEELKRRNKLEKK